MDILLIGGTRFTGPKLVDRLASAGHRVTVFNRGNRELVTDHDITFVVGDRHEETDVRELFATRSFGAIVDTCAHEPADVEPLLQADCDPERYVCYSTAGVYSETGIVPSRETDDRGENPFWGAYGADKAALEDRLFRAHEETGFPATVFRFPYIYGPGNHLYREAALFDQVRTDGPVPVPSDGQTLLQFIYVSDVARAVADVIKNRSKWPVGEAFNVGEPRSYTYGKVVDIVAAVTDSETQTVSFKAPETATAVFELVPFGSRHLSTDVSKWLQFADWEFTSLRDGLAESLAWYDQTAPDYDEEYAL